MKIRLLGAHNCESKDTRMAGVLVDDVIAFDAGSLTSSLSLAEQRDLRAILLTHHHYDHIRDVAAIAMNLYLARTGIDVYAPQLVYEILTGHILNNEVYPNFFARPPEAPALRFKAIEPLKARQVHGYRIRAVAVPHSIPAVGYEVISGDGKSLFYTGDTGPGLSTCWPEVSPQLVIVEITVPRGFEDFGRESGHLTPSLLRDEMLQFQELKGYVPEVVATHMSPGLERQIKAELTALASDLNTRILVGYEGMELRI